MLVLVCLRVWLSACMYMFWCKKMYVRFGVCVCVGGHKYVNLSTSKAETRRQKCVVYMFFCCVFLTYIEFTITL